MTLEGVQKQFEQLEWHLKYSPDSADKLIDSMILELWKLKHRDKDSYYQHEVKDLLIDIDILFDLVQWSFNQKKTKEQLAIWLQEQGLQQCPICEKWTKELHTIETALRHLWMTFNPKEGLDKKHAEPQKVCGWCHDYIMDNYPPEPGDDDTAYDVWVENQPDYPDDREDFY